MTTARNLIDAAPMSRLQIGIFVLAALVNMAEGYDIMSTSLANVGVTADWGLTGTQSGMLLSASVIGMALGAVGLSPIGDRTGRRPLLILSLSIIVVGMLLSALSTSFLMLFAARVLAGIGMGAYIPSLPIIVGEFAPSHRRSSMIGFYALGIPIGGAVFGGIASVLINQSGWRSAFFLGTALTVIMLVLVIVFMPESPEHLEGRGAAGEAKLHRLLSRMNIDPKRLGQPVAGTVPSTQADAVHATELTAVGGFKLVGIGLAVTCLTWVMVNGVYTFANTWTPQLLVGAGLSESGGINSAIILTAGGAVGTLLFAFLAFRFSAIRIAVTALVFGAGAFVLFGYSTGSLSQAMLSAFLLGVCLSMVFTALYAILPSVFVPTARVRAMGTAAAVGRIGGIAAPLIVGMLIDQGWSAATVLQTMAAPALVAAGLLIWTGVLHHRSVAVNAATPTASRAVDGPTEPEVFAG